MCKLEVSAFLITKRMMSRMMSLRQGNVCANPQMTTFPVHYFLTGVTQRPAPGLCWCYSEIRKCRVAQSRKASRPSGVERHYSNLTHHSTWCGKYPNAAVRFVAACSTKNSTIVRVLLHWENNRCTQPKADLICSHIANWVPVNRLSDNWIILIHFVQ